MQVRHQPTWRRTCTTCDAILLADVCNQTLPKVTFFNVVYSAQSFVFNKSALTSCLSPFIPPHEDSFTPGPASFGYFPLWSHAFYPTRKLG